MKLSPVCLLLFAFLFPCIHVAGKVKSNQLPNFVLIFIDDMGYGDASCFDATGYTTPNIHKLAAGGMRFTNFYSAQPVCSASRAALLTGCDPNRIGINGALFPDAKIGINPTETTIAEMLKQKGYASAIFGKWHLDDAKEFLPLQHGFDEYCVLPYSNDMWPLDGLVQPVNKEHRRSSMPTLPLIEGNETKELITDMKGQDKLTTLYTEKAVSFINRNAGKPFFLYIPHTMSHVPLGVSEKFRGKSEQGMYGDVMMEIDWIVGEIAKAIETKGIAENTVIIFTSDNGPWLNYGKNNLNAVRKENWKLILPHSWDSYDTIPGKNGLGSPRVRIKTAEKTRAELGCLNVEIANGAGTRETGKLNK